MTDLKKEEKQREQDSREEKKEGRDYEEKWKRALADYRNLEKRVAKERKDLSKFAGFMIVSKLLPVLDDLESAVAAEEDSGLRQILRKFKEVLEEEGVEEIVAEGKEFDPSVMECVEKAEDVEEKEAVVKKVVRKGYTLKGKLLRPARVVVEN
ncbi:MAG: nucleotide exchange factor GrpE [Patescibacteria group bacterium]